VLQTAKATGNTELVTLAENAITSLVPGAVAINDVVAGTKFNQTTNPAE
jgi:nitrogen fixation protein FixH